MMSATEQKVCKIVARILGLEEEQVGLNSSFQEDLGADSIDVVEVVIAMEDEFGIDIPDERAEQVTTVQHVVDCINEIQAIDSQGE
jgi:acyl carrier protein